MARAGSAEVFEEFVTSSVTHLVKADDMNTNLIARHTSPGWHMAASLILISVIIGCTTHDRQGLQGIVTLDGQPLTEGSIAFRPKPGTSGPTAGAVINEDGTYVVDHKGGTFIGVFQVQITAARKTGRQIQDQLTGNMVDEYEQYIPVMYNTETTLEVEVTEDGPNEFDFELKSE